MKVQIPALFILAGFIAIDISIIIHACNDGGSWWKLVLALASLCAFVPLMYKLVVGLRR